VDRSQLWSPVLESEAPPQSEGLTSSVNTSVQCSKAVQILTVQCSTQCNKKQCKHEEDHRRIIIPPDTGSIMVTPVKKVPIHLQSAQNRVIIRNGIVVNDDGEEQVDVYIEDGIVRLMGNHLIIPGGTRQIDAIGKFVLPGGIDTNVSLQRPGHGTQTIDDFYQGTKAALMGGTTMVVDTVVPDKEESLVEAYDKWRRWADEKVCCDYSLKVAIPRIDDDVAREIEELTGSECGVNTFVVQMSGRERMMRDAEMIETLDNISRVGGLCMVYAENGDIVSEAERKMMAAGVSGPEGHAMAHPEEAESEAVMRACVLANQVGCPLYLASLSSSTSTTIVSKRKSKGCVVSAEVTAASLACDGSNYWNKCWRHAAAFVCTPPLREGEMDELLNAAIKDEVDVVSSQHTAYNSQQKALGKDNFIAIPNGVTGVEERLLVLWHKGVSQGKMTRTRFVELSSSNPAKLMNIYPQKGRVAVGSDADLVIWDPNATKTLGKDEQLSKCDFSVYEGLQITGAPEYVIFKGRMVTDQGLFRPMTGYGQFQHLPPFAPHVYNKLREKKESSTVCPVARSAEDMITVNGTDEIPPELPEDDNKVVNQQRSSLDMTSHPQTPDFDEVRNSPSRSSVSQHGMARVRAPPGGQSSGFW